MPESRPGIWAECNALIEDETADENRLIHVRTADFFFMLDYLSTESHT